MEIFFPLIDPSCWPRMGRKSLREMNRLPLREMAIARSDLRRIVAEFNATPSSFTAPDRGTRGNGSRSGHWRWGAVRVRNLTRRGRKRKAAQRHLTLGLNRVRSRALNTDF